MTQDVPLEETLLLLAIGDDRNLLRADINSSLFTDVRRELFEKLQRIKMESGIPGPETLRLVGTSDEAISLFLTISEDVPPAESVSHVIAGLRDVSGNRATYDLCRSFNEKLHKGVPPSEYLNDLERQALAVRKIIEGDSNDGSGLKRGNDLMELLAEIEWAAKNPGKLKGLATGFQEIDQATLGLQPGRLYIVGARPSVGKTSFLMSLAVPWVRAEEHGAIFTLEMPRVDIQTSALVIESGVSRSEYPNLTKVELAKLQRAMQEMQKWDWLIDDTGSINIDILCHRARAAHKEKKLKWLGIDYIQLIRPSKDKANRSQEVAEVSGKLKSLAKELGIPIIALCQLNRQQQVVDVNKGKKADPEPKLSHLRESGDLEQDADAVFLLHRDQEDQSSQCVIIGAKNRFGRLFRQLAEFVPKLSKFEPCNFPR